MSGQNYEAVNIKIEQAFENLKNIRPEELKKRLNLSWSNWGFGLEKFSDSCVRLAKYGIEYIELHGNHYGSDLGYKPAEIRKILDDYGIKTSGVCGMFSADNDLASNRPIKRQAAIDYLKREIDFAREVEGEYLLVVPGAVGRAVAYDDCEFERSVEALRRVADIFVSAKIKAAIEPIRADEVSLIHTFSDAKRYIKAVNHPGVLHINGDTYHMQAGEAHIGQAILDAGEMLTNLHIADTNRCALGTGFLDIDTIIKALYIIGYNDDKHFVTPEPLGPGGNPYSAMYGKPDKEQLDTLVRLTAKYFKRREEEIIG